MSHNIVDEPFYAPKSLGDHLDALRADLAATHSLLRQRDLEARDWRERHEYLEHWFCHYAGRKTVDMVKRERPDLYPGLAEHLDRSA